MSRRVLFLAPVAFDGLRQRHQGLAIELARAGYRVDYVDPLRSSGWGASSRGSTSPLGTMTGDRLRIWQVAVPFRAARKPALQKITIALARTALRRVGIDFRDEGIVWIADPAWSSLRSSPRCFRLYDRCDRHGAFPGQDRTPWQEHEKALYQASDLILATTAILADEAASEGARAVLTVPNAVDASWIAEGPGKRPRTSANSLPATDERIRVISAGAHYEWVDCDWLAALADHPRLELHVAGPGRGASWERLRRHPRVVFHGTLDHERLRTLITTMRVGLIPFIPSALTETVDPVKVYEYAACGLQVWATPVSPLGSHPLVDRIVDDPRSIIDSEIDALFARGEPRKPIPTWRDRLEQVLEHLPPPEGS